MTGWLKRRGIYLLSGATAYEFQWKRLYLRFNKKAYRPTSGLGSCKWLSKEDAA